MGKKEIAVTAAALVLGFGGGVVGSALHPGQQGPRGAQGPIGQAGPTGPIATPYPTPVPTLDNCAIWSAPDFNGQRICQVFDGGIVNPSIVPSH